jgi:hypothetical protein
MVRESGRLFGVPAVRAAAAVYVALTFGGAVILAGDPEWASSLPRGAFYGRLVLLGLVVPWIISRVTLSRGVVLASEIGVRGRFAASALAGKAAAGVLCSLWLVVLTGPVDVLIWVRTRESSGAISLSLLSLLVFATMLVVATLNLNLNWKDPVSSLLMSWLLAGFALVVFSIAPQFAIWLVVIGVLTLVLARRGARGPVGV